jgi:hypothetical protein
MVCLSETVGIAQSVSLGAYIRALALGKVGVARFFAAFKSQFFFGIALSLAT